MYFCKKYVNYIDIIIAPINTIIKMPKKNFYSLWLLCFLMPATVLALDDISFYNIKRAQLVEDYNQLVASVEDTTIKDLKEWHKSQKEIILIDDTLISKLNTIADKYYDLLSSYKIREAAGRDIKATLKETENYLKWAIYASGAFFLMCLVLAFFLIIKVRHLRITNKTKAALQLKYYEKEKALAQLSGIEKKLQETERSTENTLVEIKTVYESKLNEQAGIVKSIKTELENMQKNKKALKNKYEKDKEILESKLKGQIEALAQKLSKKEEQYNKVLNKDVAALKKQADAYKQLLDEELMVRKDIIKFIEDLKTLK